MTTTPDPQLVQELATELMLDAAREVDYMGIGERYFDDERCADLDDEQKEALQDAISDFISEATVTVAATDEQPQDERDARIAELEREVRELRGTELNPSPMALDAQAYNELRDEIAATMGNGWDLDEAEISILIKYVRWLAAGQPRDEDGYPIRHKTPEGLGGASGASRCRNSEATTQPQDDGDVRAVAALRDALRAGGRGWGEVDALIARFADRIAALDARDAKGGERQ